LAAVLKRVKSEEREFGYFFTGCPYAEYATLILRALLVWKKVVIQKSIATKQGQVPIQIGAVLGLFLSRFRLATP
jgi:hypothetical protein